MPTEPPSQSLERDDLLQTLATHRQFLRHTCRGLSDAQARQRTSASELCLGGIIKHVSRTESRWADFIVSGPDAMGGMDEDSMKAHAESFRMSAEDTLADLLASYDEVAGRTETLVRSLPSLDIEQPLPEAPWFPPGTKWSARHVLLHILAETAQHAGHADIVRESLDGAKTMG